MNNEKEYPVTLWDISDSLQAIWWYNTLLGVSFLLLVAVLFWLRTKRQYSLWGGTLIALVCGGLLYAQGNEYINIVEKAYYANDEEKPTLLIDDKAIEAPMVSVLLPWPTITLNVTKLTPRLQSETEIFKEAIQVSSRVFVFLLLGMGLSAFTHLMINGDKRPSATNCSVSCEAHDRMETSIAKVEKQVTELKAWIAILVLAGSLFGILYFAV